MRPRRPPHPWPLGLMLGAVVAVADVVLNRDVEASLRDRAPITAWPPLQLELSDLGHLAPGSAVALALAGAASLAGLAWARTRLASAAFGLVFGGVFGNVLDAAAGGRVWDLVSVHLPGRELRFNASDLSLLAGGALLLVALAAPRRAR